MTDLLENTPAPEPASNSPEMSVSELSNRLKRTVEEAYSFVRVRGELGRVTIAKSGHMYADLKDDKAVLNTIMWKGQVSRLPFRPEEGLEVVAEGKLSTYPGRSNYQMIADTMRPAGVGALMQLLEERKKKFAAEGLFAEERKKALPYLPEVIGVVTSPTGAVIRDILHRVRDRYPVRVQVWPVLVQGEKAAEQIAEGIRGFNALTGEEKKFPRPDVIIVARGGGSIEDLWAFNEELVVRAAAESEIPLISAVGHETDTTLIDYVSDRRAPTPTGAAEIALPVRAELITQVETFGLRSRRGLQRSLESRKVEFRATYGRIPKPISLVQGPRQRFDYAAEKLTRGFIDVVNRRRSLLDKTTARLQPIALQREIVRRRTEVDTLHMRAKFAARRVTSQKFADLDSIDKRYEVRDPRKALPAKQEKVDQAFARMDAAMKRYLEKRTKHLETWTRLLSTVSHESVLARGFVLVQRMNGELVRRAADIDSGERLKLQFADDEKRVTADYQEPKERPRIITRQTGANGEQGDLF